MLILIDTNYNQKWRGFHGCRIVYQDAVRQNILDLRKLGYEFPQADIKEFTELLKNGFYHSLPLKDFSGHNIVYAQIAKTEREAELKSKKVEVKKQSLDAEVRAAADADRYRKEQEAQAALYQRQKDAEAVRYEQEQAAEAAKKAAEAAHFAKEQESAGIAAVGQAEAEAIWAKALAEAEGIDKKAEAMKKYGEAAVIEMIMNALPEIAKNVAEPLSKEDKITMYGEGNSAKLLSDIVNGITQVTEGISAGMGLNLKSLLAGALGGKLAVGNSQSPQVVITQPAQSVSEEAAAASAETPEQQV